MHEKRVAPSVSVKTLREEQQLSQEGLARKLGVSVRTVARWEGGHSQPSSLAMNRLQQAMAVPIESETEMKDG